MKKDILKDLLAKPGKKHLVSDFCYFTYLFLINYMGISVNR
mgnify:CR=1 FL=1